MIKESPVGINPILPEELTERHQWVCWSYEERDGKTTKVPYTAGTTERASSTDPATWSSFRDALGMSTYYDGIGFVFTDDDPYTGIDLDNCRDPETGKIESWAMEIVSQASEAGGYVEISPSGSGIHIIVGGTTRRGGKTQRKVLRDGEVLGKIEMYSRERFFTVTGDLL